jgi:hypothetical protein
MRKKLCVLVLYACSLATVSLAEQCEKYTALIMPDNVTLGMSLDAVQSVRPDAKKLAGMVGSRNTNAVVLTEMKGEAVPLLLYQYHFIDGYLRAVTKSITYGYGRKRKQDEQTIKSVRDALARDLVKKSDEPILRLDEHMQQISMNAEIWADEKNGACVYFVDASNEMRVITVDPKYFQKKDFFMSPDEMPKIAPALEAVRKTIEELEKLKK